MTDNEKWIGRLRRGDHDSWTRIECHVRHFFSTLIPIPLRSHIDEMVTDTMWEFLRSLDNPSRAIDVRRYAFGIARNVARRGSSYVPKHPPLASFERVERLVARPALNSVLVFETLAKLTIEELELLSLILDAHQTQQSICEALGVSPGTYWNRRSALKRKIQRLLDLSRSRRKSP